MTRNVSGENKMTIQNKTKKAVLGLIAGAAIAGNVAASNTADLTAFHRQVPAKFYMISTSKNSNWIAGVQPFGNKNQFSALEFILQDETNKYFKEAIVSGHANAGKFGIDAAVDASQYDSFKPEYKLGLDVSGKNYGLGAIISQNNADIGARASYKRITAFMTSPVMQKINPAYGITVNSKYATVDASYQPSTDTKDVTVSKTFSTKHGLIIPQIRACGSTNLNYSIAVGFIPTGAK